MTKPSSLRIRHPRQSQLSSSSPLHTLCRSQSSAFSLRTAISCFILCFCTCALTIFHSIQLMLFQTLPGFKPPRSLERPAQRHLSKSAPYGQPGNRQPWPFQHLRFSFWPWSFMCLCVGHPRFISSGSSP